MDIELLSFLLYQVVVVIPLLWPVSYIRDFSTISKQGPRANDFGKMTHKSVKLGKWIQNRKEIICMFGVNLRIFHQNKYFEGNQGMLYVPTTNVQGFIYYFGIFYLKIGNFYTFFQLGKGQEWAPKSAQENPCTYMRSTKLTAFFFSYTLPILLLICLTLY